MPLLLPLLICEVADATAEEEEKGSRGRSGGEVATGCRWNDFREADGEVRQDRAAQSIWSSGEEKNEVTKQGNGTTHVKLTNHKEAILLEEK